MAAPAPQLSSHGYVITKPVRGSEIPVDLTFVLTRDEIYVPIAVRKPPGNGPFPAITMARGNGRGGMPFVEVQVERLASLQDRIIQRGYVVATVNYRNEIPLAYGSAERSQNLSDSMTTEGRTLKSVASLDSDDLIAAFDYLKTLPYVKPRCDRRGRREPQRGSDPEGRGGDELRGRRRHRGRLARIPERGHGPGVPRKNGEIQYQDIELARKNADKARAMERIRRINTPILHIGRDQDHLQGIFKLAHEWMLEAGKDSTWVSFDHPDHGYPLVYRKPDGSYAPDPVQQQAIDVFMEYFDRKLKR